MCVCVCGSVCVGGEVRIVTQYHVIFHILYVWLYMPQSYFFVCVCVTLNVRNFILFACVCVYEREREK